MNMDDTKKDDGINPLKLPSVDWYSEAAEKYQKEAVESWKNLPPDAVFGSTDRYAVGITAMKLTEPPLKIGQRIIISLSILAIVGLLVYDMIK